MKKTRMITDSLMLVLLPLLMAYSLIGEDKHEMIGICMFAVFIIHHAINRRWWMGIFREKYSPARLMNTVVNILMSVYMILQPISGILMSKYVLKEVMIDGTSGVLRTIHMTVAYWGFMLLSFHLGLHIRAVSASLKKKVNKTVYIMITAIVLLTCAYGVYAFVQRGIGDYLLMRVMFAYFDFGESRVRFLFDYAAVMVLVASIGFYIQKGIVYAGKKKERKMGEDRQRSRGARG